MGRVSYDGHRIIPAPFVGINKAYNFGDDGSKLGQSYQITLNGSLVAGKGSPAAIGLYDLGGYPSDETLTSTQHLTNLMRKQEELRKLFITDGKWLEIQGDDGAAPLKFQPIINSIDFEQDVWFNQTKYTVQMTADRMWGRGSPEDSNSNLINASENWQIDFDEQNQTYNLSHSLNAQARPSYNSGVLIANAWQIAKDWVIPRLGQNDEFIKSNQALFIKDTYFSGGPIQLYNNIRTEQIGVLDNTYSASETWVISNKTYTEEYTVTLQSNSDGPDGINVEGSIQGYQIKDSGMVVTTSKYASALTGWTIASGEMYTRALNYSELSYINPKVLTSTVGRNEKQGTITYNYNYDTRPPNIVANSKYESITINDTNPGKIVAVIPVLGRSKGPVLQDIGTYNERRRQISIEIVLKNNWNLDVIGTPDYPKFMLQQAKPNTDTIVDYLKPTVDSANGSPNASKSYKVADTETFDLSTSRYTRNLEYIYEV